MFHVRIPTVERVGSGLILLVIVGAWLAVLVPMAVKSHDSSASLKSADKFSDAMRVLSSRRTPGDRREVVVPRPAQALPPLTAAERRRRTLATLVGVALLSLGLGLMGSTLLLGLHVACDLLLAGFVVHLRQQAIRRAEKAARARRPARPGVAPVVPQQRTAGIPDRMPARPEPLTAPLPAPAARYEDKPAVADNGWEPVPVPVPTYVGKAVAPRRPPRVLDLTKPGEWTAALEDSGLDILDDGPELEEILDRRKAANGW